MRRFKCEICDDYIDGSIDGWNAHMVLQHDPILRGFFFPPDEEELATPQQPAPAEGE